MFTDIQWPLFFCLFIYFIYHRHRTHKTRSLKVQTNINNNNIIIITSKKAKTVNNVDIKHQQKQKMQTDHKQQLKHDE